MCDSLYDTTILIFLASCFSIINFLACIKAKWWQFSTIGYFPPGYFYSNIGVMRKLGCELPSIVLLESLNFAWHSGDSIIRVSWCTQSLVKLCFWRQHITSSALQLHLTIILDERSIFEREWREEGIHNWCWIQWWTFILIDVVHIQLIKGCFFSVYP